MRAALAGEREPLAELLRRHFDVAVALSARILGSADLAADAAQEAAIAAMTSLGSLRSPERFGAWFCGIALNVSRRWARQLRAEVRWPGSEVPAAGSGPAEAAEAAEEAARVRAAVLALPEGQRAAVWLFYLQGLSEREVAAGLGVTVGAVKSRLHQARAALAPALSEMSDTSRSGNRRETVMSVTDVTSWPEVTVTGIRRSTDGEGWQRKHVMILAERGGGRFLPIWIGPAEAAAMALQLEAAEPLRPFTATLAANLVRAAGARIEEVRITRLDGGVFYAAVLVGGRDGVREVDARPSDAVNLALASGRPVRVEAGLLSAHGAGDSADALASFPVATADIADEVRRRQREDRREADRP